MRMRALIRAGLAALYPPGCPACGAPVGDPSALCADCWREAAFLGAAACDRCAAPLEGGDALLSALPGPRPICRDCLFIPPQWRKGRAAMLYEGAARKLILSLKHGGRSEIAPAMANWMARAGADMLRGADLLIPVPLHWTRRMRRGFNQSEDLGRALAGHCDARHLPYALSRIRRTPSQGGRSKHLRAVNVEGAFSADPALVSGRRAVLIDDVMTTGATLNACAAALRGAGAARVDALVFARVAQFERTPISFGQEENPGHGHH